MNEQTAVAENLVAVGTLGDGMEVEIYDCSKKEPESVTGYEDDMLLDVAPVPESYWEKKIEAANEKKREELLKNVAELVADPAAAAELNTKIMELAAARMVVIESYSETEAAAEVVVKAAQEQLAEAQQMAQLIRNEKWNKADEAAPGLREHERTQRDREYKVAHVLYGIEEGITSPVIKELNEQIRALKYSAPPKKKRKEFAANVTAQETLLNLRNKMVLRIARDELKISEGDLKHAVEGRWRVSYSPA